MKYVRIYVAILSALIMSLAGCTKGPVEQFVGSYTYKTSGIVGLAPAALVAKGLPSDTTWIALYPEQGQMNVVKDNDSDKLVVSWNDLTGNVCTTTASVDGHDINLIAGTKTAQLTDGDNKLGGGIVSYQGKGQLYDNLLIIPMSYTGTFSVSNVSMTVVSSKVECVAKTN